MSTNAEAANSPKHWRTKAQFAAHLQIGVRTVTSLMHRKLLPYTKVRNLVRFDEDECDRTLEFFKTPSRLKGNRQRPTGSENERQWRTKRQIAAHLGCSERTITTLMRQRILPYLKIQRLVRMDQAECDRLMEVFKTQSILERRFNAQTDRGATELPNPTPPPGI